MIDDVSKQSAPFANCIGIRGFEGGPAMQCFVHSLKNGQSVGERGSHTLIGHMSALINMKATYNHQSIL